MNRAAVIVASIISAGCSWAAVGALGIAGISTAVAAQEGTAAPRAPTATITFTLNFPQSNPEHYLIAVDANGHARYECTGKVAEDSEEQTYRAEFEMSAVNRERIFGLAKQAKYFAGDIDSGNAKLAFTGTKVLSYQDGQRSTQGQFNYSSLGPVRELTTLFQNIAGTMEYGRKLAYYHRYQKLALDDELKRMESQARSNELSEIQGLSPVLQEIIDDASVINGVRARAKELLEMGTSAPAKR